MFTRASRSKYDGQCPALRAVHLRYITALVNVQLGIWFLILHFQHIRHRRFPGVGNTLLDGRANQARIAKPVRRPIGGYR